MSLYLLIDFILIGCSALAIIVFRKRLSNILAPTAMTAFILMLIASSLSIVLVHFGVIGFNGSKLVGIHLINIPLEEILFYFSFTCFTIVIYETAKIRFSSYNFKWANITLRIFASLAMLILALTDHVGLYTLTVLLLVAVVVIIWGFFDNLNLIGITIILCITPYLLTRIYLIEEPDLATIWHDDSQQHFFKLGTLPPEEILDGIALIAASIFTFEFIQKMRYK